MTIDEQHPLKWPEGFGRTLIQDRRDQRQWKKQISVLDSSAVPQGTNSPRWEAAKRRMPGKPAMFIDLLLEYGPMTVTNFVTLGHCSKKTVYNTVSKLCQSGVAQNIGGGKYALKEN